MGIVFIFLLIIFNHSTEFKNKILALPIGMLGLWLIFQLIAQVIGSENGEDSGASLLFVRLAVTTSILMALAYYYSIRVYMRKAQIGFKDALVFVAVVVMASLALTDFSVQKAISDAQGISIEEASYLYYVQTATAVLLFSVALVRLYKYTKRLPRNERAREYTLLISSAQVVLLSGGGSIFFAHVAAAQVLIFVSAFIFCVGIFFGIFRHKLFDIRFVVVRTVGYTMSIATLAATYFFAAYLVSILFFQGSTTSEVSISPVNIALAILLSFIFQPVKHFFDKVTDKVFFHGMYDTDEFYARFNAILSDTTDMTTLLTNTSSELLNTLKTAYVHMVVLRDKHPDVQIGKGKYVKFPEQDIQAFVELLVLREKDAQIRLSDVRHRRSIYRLFSSHGIEILLPLFQQDILVGFIAIGPRNSSQYSRRDTKLLNTISDELVIAIQNALSLQEVKDINANLEQRIEHATQQLRTSNARLVRIDATKDEFLNMASHQLRTPLTTVKGYLSMVLEGDAGKVSKKQEQLLGEAFASSERMVNLIHDFLNVSRLQTGKFALELGEYDLHKIISDEIDTLRTAAKGRNIQIKFDDKAGKTMVTIDETKVHQVVMNFIDNAMYYTKPGGTITVHTAKHRDEVEMRVVDNGIGVPHDEQVHLFNKFFRATNARKQRPDGTGVGLYLAKKIVDAHHGEIIFESKEGKGSTFGFRLPLKNNHNQLDNKPNQ